MCNDFAQVHLLLCTLAIMRHLLQMLINKLLMLMQTLMALKDEH